MTYRIGGITVSPIYMRGRSQEVLPVYMGIEKIGIKEMDENADHMTEDITF